MRKVIPSKAAMVPSAAKRVFEGQIFDVYQWSQEMFDGSHKTFEMLKRPDTVQIIAIHDNKIVLVEDEQPGSVMRTHLPGGRVDATDDSWLNAAQRELLEETGLVFANWKLIDVQQPIPKAEWFIPVFLATGLLEEREQSIDADGERITVIKTDYESLRRNALHGLEPTMQYLIPLFNKCQNIEQLVSLAEFSGNTVERP